MRHNKLVGA